MIFVGYDVLATFCTVSEVIGQTPHLVRRFEFSRQIFVRAAGSDFFGHCRFDRTHIRQGALEENIQRSSFRFGSGGW